MDKNINNSPIKKITSMFFLLIFFLSIFICIVMPIEINKVLKSQSWEPRDLEIQSSKVIRTQNTGSRTRRGRRNRYHYSIEIFAKDLANDNSIKISDVRYGDMPFTISAFGKIFFSAHESDVKKYPAGARVTGYKDPNSNKYILERGNIILPVTILSIAALWLIGNVFVMILYPKSKNKQEDFLLNN